MMAGAQQLNPRLTQRIVLQGTVQGIGMRPWLAANAAELGLNGRTNNSADGVHIDVSGPATAIDTLLARLQGEPPAGALIRHIERYDIAGNDFGGRFLVETGTPQQAADARTDLRTDTAICDACRQEIIDPASRRYRHALNNCNSCGPRAAIQHSAIWARQHTANAPFPLCNECSREYRDPLNRRFHSEGINCARCAPQPQLERVDGRGFALESFTNLDAVDAVASLLMRGEIVAIQGITGFHLACDAGNAGAVTRLRAGKQRPAKPLAMMARDIDIIGQYAELTAAETNALLSPAAPIVLLHKRPGSIKALADTIAPGLNTLGFMLPATALHQLIFMRLEIPVVMTSANCSGAPLCTDLQALRDEVKGLADWVLHYPRDICTPADDSVISIGKHGAQIMRYGRGYVPQTIALPTGFKHRGSIIGSGGPWKSSACILSDNEAVLLPQLGELDAPAMRDRYRDNLSAIARLRNTTVKTVVSDLYQDCPAAAITQQLFSSASVAKVQHHHAHAAACMIDNDIAPDSGRRLAVIFDGMGLGDNGELWGGEFLLADYSRYTRLAALPAVAMPGGALAATQPWRNTWAQLCAGPGWQAVDDNFGALPVIQALRQQPLKQLQHAVAAGTNSPRASSAGRLFDAVAALLGLAPQALQYEAQAAMLLEQAAAKGTVGATNCAITLQPEADLLRWNLTPMWVDLLQGLHNKQPVADLALAFHRSLAQTIAATAQALRNNNAADWPNSDVLLSGGVFQNRLLLNLCIKELNGAGFKPLYHRRLPANDGGLPVGQVAIAAARAQEQL